MPARSGYSFSILNYDGTASSTRADFADMFARKDLFLNAGLYVWGRNDNAALGIGNINNIYSSPVQVGSLTNWKQVVYNNTSGIGLKTDGTMWSWGSNFLYGTTGQNTTAVDYSSPVQIGSLSTWSYIDSKYYQCHAIKTDGTLWTWGYNGFNQLGNGTGANYSSPIQIGNSTDWRQVVSNAYHALATKTNGTLWGWGYSISGGVGVGPGLISYNSPVQIGSLSSWEIADVGYQHSVALEIDGTLWTWGAGSSGQLGNNSVTSYSSPIQIGSSTDWKYATAGYTSTFAIKQDGTLWAWGDNTYGNLGNNTIVPYSSPIQIGGLTNWKRVRAETYHTVAVKTDGTLWTWGYGIQNQLGNGTSGFVYYSSPVQVGSLTSWKNVACGYYNTAGIITPDITFNAYFPGTITYSLGTAGAGGIGASNGSAGTASTLSYAGVTLTANGGNGGTTGAAATATGGTATGGQANATGGSGGQSGNNRGAGGGGGINGGNATNAAAGGAGTNGANPVDFNGLALALQGTSYVLGAGGVGSAALVADNDNGWSAYSTNVGAGGGGASSNGGNGGSAGPGGGGGGAVVTTVSKNGGDGGSGLLVVRINNTTTYVLTSGTSFAIPQNAYSVKVWLIGAGGGGGGGSSATSTDGNGGGAGGMSYYAWGT